MDAPLDTPASLTADKRYPRTIAICFEPAIPDELYLALRQWVAEWLPTHRDQVARLNELRHALAQDDLPAVIVYVHTLCEMATYRPAGKPRRTDECRARGLQLLPELSDRVRELDLWSEALARQCDEAWMSASRWARAAGYGEAPVETEEQDE
jgi:hypothetical protein